MTEGSCPTPERLVALLLGKLPEMEFDSLSHHVESCGRCEKQIETLNAADSMTVAVARPVGSAIEVSAEGQQVLNRLEQESERFGQTRLGPSAESLESELPPLLGNYEVLEQIGWGGMGSVFKVRHIRLDRIFALKILNARRSLKTSDHSRFEREWQAIGRAGHPNIVQPTDAGEQDGFRFLVMEYVDGFNLSKVARRHEHLAVDDACELIRQTALGLAAAHDVGLIHRDVKPSNVMLTAMGQVKILDLGIALLTDEDSGTPALTSSGEILGTSEFMSPEQIEQPHTVDQRSDIYGLGCTLYCLLTGRPPFGPPQQSTLRQILNAHVSSPHPPIANRRDDVPAGLVAVLDQMLAKEPEQRYPDMPAVAAALAPFTAEADLHKLAATAELESAAASNLDDAIRQAGSTAGAVSIPDDTARGPRFPGTPDHHQAGQYLRPTRRRWKRAAFAATLLPLLLAAVIIVIKTRDGETTLTVDGDARVVVDNRQNPPRVTIETKEPQDDAADAGKNLKSSAAGVPQVNALAENALPGLVWAEQLREKIGEAPLPEAGSPLSAMATVSAPTAIEGVHSWSLESRQHWCRINVCALDPAAKRLLTGGNDGALRIWNVQDRTLKQILLGHHCRVQSAQWSPDGTAILSSGGNEICVWEAGSGKLLRRIVTDERPAARLGILLARWTRSPLDVRTYSNGPSVPDGMIRFWDLGAGSSYRTLATGSGPDPHDYYKGFIVDADAGRMWAAAVRDPLQLRDVNTGAMLRTWEKDSQFSVLALSVDGKILATAGHDTSIHLWDAETGEALLPEPLVAKRLVVELAFSPDGQRLAAISRAGNHVIQLWQTGTGRELASIETPHAQVTSICWSSDGSLLVSAGTGSDQAICFWDGPTGRPFGAIGGGHVHRPAGLDWHPRENRVAVGSVYETTRPANVTLYELSLQEPAERFATAWRRHDYPLWSGSGRYPITDDLILRDLGQQNSTEIEISFPFHDELRALSADDRWLAVAGTDSAKSRYVLLLLKMPEGEVVHELLEIPFAPEAGIDGLDFSPDSRRVAVSWGRGGEEPTPTVTVYETASGKLVLSRPIQGGEHRRGGLLKWSPDGKVIAVDDVWIVRPYDAETLGRTLPLLEHNLGSASGLRDMTWLDADHLAGVAKGKIQVWKVKQSEENAIRPIQSLSAWPSPYVNITSSPDGRFIATTYVGYGAPVDFWDWKSGRRLAVLKTSASKLPAALMIGATGHYRTAGETAMKDLLYVVQTPEGQSVLAPAQFEETYGWKNDPSTVPDFQSQPAP